MMSEKRATVSVWPAAALTAQRGLFDALEAVFAVRFVARRPDATNADGAIAVAQDNPSAGAARDGAPILAYVGANGPGGVTRDVRVGSDQTVDRRLRETVLLEQAIGRPVRPDEHDVPLAVSVDGPAWTRRVGPLRVDRVGSPLPELGEGMTLLQALHGPHSLGLVALVEFLRALDANGWSAPELRAAFVFDDPNLRRNRYGYLDYRQLVAHADDHGYHAAMAMVPLDARCHSDAAVAMFRGRPDRLSIVMHGNNHSVEELMTARDFPEALALSAQALRRVAWFEAKTSLSVSRVMMPPHASWSRIGARALGALGYDGLCSTHPYPTTEPAPDGRVLAGWTGVDFFDGCAVIPRVPLSMDRTGLALRAFLDQPLVLYGHHGDLARGLEPLAAAAALVNGLGDVRWCSVGEMVCGNHALRIHDETLQLRPGAQRMRFVVPEGVRRLLVEAPLGAGASAGLSGWTASGIDGPPRAFGDAAPVGGGTTVVRLHTPWETDPRTIASPPRSFSAIFQRRLNEIQDRVAPLRRPRVSV
jgi:hypothetical protein